MRVCTFPRKIQDGDATVILKTKNSVELSTAANHAQQVQHFTMVNHPFLEL
jgi:hypothetical protein